MTIVEELVQAKELADGECKMKEAAQVELAKCKADLAASLASVDGLKAEMAAAKKASDETIESLKTQLSDATKKLENPAFKVAGAGAEVVAENAIGSEPVQKTEAEWNKEHDAIKDPKAQEAFRIAHKKELGLK